MRIKPLYQSRATTATLINTSMNARVSHRMSGGGDAAGRYRRGSSSFKGGGGSVNGDDGYDDGGTNSNKAMSVAMTHSSKM